MTALVVNILFKRFGAVDGSVIWFESSLEMAMIWIPLKTGQEGPTVVLLLTAGYHGSRALIGQVALWKKRVKDRQEKSERGTGNRTTQRTLKNRWFWRLLIMNLFTLILLFLHKVKIFFYNNRKNNDRKKTIWSNFHKFIFILLP